MQLPLPPRILTLLAAANFAIGMGAFIAIAVMTPVAREFAIDMPTAGWLMTAYALVYAVSSPVLVSATGAVDRTRLLVVGLSVFALGAVASATAPSYMLLLIGRSLMAMGGGLVTPVAAAIAIANAAPDARGKALATTFGGLTLAQVVGIPVGAWLAYTAGWRYAFGGVAALTALMALLIAWQIPRLQAPALSLKTLWEVLAKPWQLVAVAFTAFFVGGLYALYTYLTPFLEQRYTLTRDGVTLMLIVFGLGAVLGNRLGGWLTDRVGATRSLVALGLVQAIIMPVMTDWTWGLVTMGLMILVWSTSSWAFMVPQQARLAALDAERVPVLFALNAAAIYVGGSLGASLGGVVLRNYGLDALGVAGSGLIVLALLSLAAVRIQALGAKKRLGEFSAP
jgi:MFS transporter, DHA1 family, inner membrane transport protein